MNRTSGISRAQGLHRDAMELAERADTERRAGQYERARELYARAYDLEKQAAALTLDTQGKCLAVFVLMRSAAALAVSSNSPDAVEYIESILRESPPEHIVQEIKELQGALDGSRYAKMALSDTNLHDLKEPGSSRGMMKSELAEALSRQTGLSKEKSIGVLDALFSTKPQAGIIVSAVASGKQINIGEFGTFKSVFRKRVGRKPQAGQKETTTVCLPTFIPGNALMDFITKNERTGMSIENSTDAKSRCNLARKGKGKKKSRNE